MARTHGSPALNLATADQPVSQKRTKATGKSGTTHYLELTVTEDDLNRAIGAESHSGRCMIAQAVTARFGPGCRPIVDSDYIRLTAPGTGDRLVYRTPPDAAAALLSFDAGIRPPLPLHIRARVAFQKPKRTAGEVPIKEVRAWARAQPEFAGVAPKAALSSAVVEAYKAAHPGKKVARQGRRVVTTSASSVLPKTVLSSGSRGNGLPPVGNLAGGSGARAKVPASRRRTWGSRVMTSVLLEQGWTAPAETAT
jgi:hypothetical protein